MKTKLSLAKTLSAAVFDIWPTPEVRKNLIRSRISAGERLLSHDFDGGQRLGDRQPY